MLDVEVINDSEVAQVSLDPIRARMLAALVRPGSATTLSTRDTRPSARSGSGATAASAVGEMTYDAAAHSEDQGR